MGIFKLKHIISVGLISLVAFNPIATATQSNLLQTASHLTISSSRIADKPFVFQAEFNLASWSGSLKKKNINQLTDGNFVLSPNDEWDAGILLMAQAPDKRVITTYNHVNKQTVLFEWEQLPTDIQKLFNQIPNTDRNDELGPQRVSYLRGERTLEGKESNHITSSFRVRESLLGDILHSTPVYIGAPSKNVIGTDYSSFYAQHKSRPGTVFVNANDGMMHAFSAETGTELFAYIPSLLLKKLPQLTDPAYQHTSTMDGNLQVAEANVSGQWKTVLTAGMGQGAKGVFALDVTAPEQFMAGQRRLFEFTEEDDPDIGYISAAPIITKINLKKNKKSASVEKYFVLVTSGHHSANTHGEQFLFLLSLDKNPAMPWSQNSNYYKIRMKTNSSITALSAPGLVFNPQGAAIYAYSGDLQGNVWRFDFSNGNPAELIPKNIFSAKDKQHNPQAITAQPVVAFGADHGYVVLFGTGNPSDNSPKQNSFYALHDLVRTDKVITDRSQLARRELVPATTGYQINGEEFSYGGSQSKKTSDEQSDVQSNAHSNKRGWYVDYLNQSEHCKELSVSEGLLAYGAVFFNTSQICSTGSNENNTSRSYKLNVMTGKPESAKQLTGFLSSTPFLGKPLLLTTPMVTSEKDAFGRRYNTQQYSVFNFAKGMEPSKATLKAGRLSWREITNWQDLKTK